MKNNNITDERVLSEKRKFESETYKILVFFLLSSTVFQQFVLRAPFSQFSVEFFSVIGAGIYMIIRPLCTGVDVGNGSARNVKSGLAIAIVVGGIATVCMMFLTGQKDSSSLILFFLCFFAIYLLFHLCIPLLFSKRQKQIDAQLDDNNEE